MWERRLDGDERREREEGANNVGEEWKNIRRGGSRRKRKGEGTTDAAAASPSSTSTVRRGARRLDCHDHENFSPVTFNFRAVGKSPPLELGHRPADSRPPPSSRDSTLPRTTALLSRPHSPPPPAKLSSRIYVASSRSNFPTRAYATFFALFFSPSVRARTKEKKKS